MAASSSGASLLLCSTSTMPLRCLISGCGCACRRPPAHSQVAGQAARPPGSPSGPSSLPPNLALARSRFITGSTQSGPAVSRNRVVPATWKDRLTGRFAEALHSSRPPPSPAVSIGSIEAPHAGLKVRRQRRIVGRLSGHGAATFADHQERRGPHGAHLKIAFFVPAPLRTVLMVRTTSLEPATFFGLAHAGSL